MWERTGLVARTVFKIAEVVARRLVGSIPTRSRHLRILAYLQGFCDAACASLRRCHVFLRKHPPQNCTLLHLVRPLSTDPVHPGLITLGRQRYRPSKRIMDVREKESMVTNGSSRDLDSRVRPFALP
jgi:hypothetical protein